MLPDITENIGIFEEENDLMKERILSPWTKKRKLYTVIGILIIGIGLLSKEWIFGIAGAYYFAMGFFSFGCAAGNCPSKSCSSSESIKN